MLLGVAEMMGGMAPPIDAAAKPRRHLAALVTQRRLVLGWTKGRARQEAGIAPMTYDKVERGDSVKPETYGAVEAAFGIVPGSCLAVLQGATTLSLVDGGVVTVETAEPSEDAELGLVRDLPLEIREGLREGQVFASGVYDLSPEEGGPQLIAVIKAPSDATPAQIRAYAQVVRRAQRQLRRISESTDESPDSNTP
jgi:hypothetical protein